ARAKYELIDSLPAGGIALLNADDEYVSQFGRDFHGKVVLYGLRSPATCAPKMRSITAPRVQRLMLLWKVVARRLHCHWSERQTSITRSRQLLSDSIAASRCPRQPELWRRSLPRTNGVRTSNSVTLRSSTIVTIPIQKRSMQWWMP